MGFVCEKEGQSEELHLEVDCVDIGGIYAGVSSWELSEEYIQLSHSFLLYFWSSRLQP
jgi:hypothetical protein